MQICLSSSSFTPLSIPVYRLFLDLATEKNRNIKTKFINSLQYDNMIWGLPFVDFLSQYSDMQNILVTDSTLKYANDSLDTWNLGRGTSWNAWMLYGVIWGLGPETKAKNNSPI